MGGFMSVAIVGGLDRLKNIYKAQGKGMGFKVKMFGQRVPALGKRISGVDAIVIFTGNVAHDMVVEASRIAKQFNIPISWSHSNSASGLKRSLLGLGGTCSK
jgi:hypothetical protein